MVAYHLSRLGETGVVVLDARDSAKLPGSTGLAPGFAGQLSATPELAVLAKESVALYRELPGEVFHPVGCLEVATSAARLEQAHRDVEHGRGLGIEARVLDAPATVARAPALVNADVALGGLFIPSDGAAGPTAITQALVAASGAEFRWRTRVHALETAHGRVVGVRTGDGVLEADQVVLAAGIWGPVLAATAGVRLPMVGVQHPYVFTTERPEPYDTPIDTPIVRYPEHTVYTRRHGRAYDMGTYSHTPLPASPESLDTAEVSFRADDFGTALERAAELVPAFRGTPQGRRLNGVFAMTPDELPLAGPSTVPGLWFAEAGWVTHAAGIGRHVANLLLGAGDTAVDPARLDPARFDDWDASKIREQSLAHYQGIYDAH